MVSLPPELMLDILELAAFSTRAPRRLLKRCSLLNRAWRFPSQALLFRHFSRLTSVEGAQAWVDADWSEFTEVLEVVIEGPKTSDDDELLSKAAELERLFASVMSRSQDVKALELHLSPVVLTSVLSLVSLRGLKHLKLTAEQYHHETAFVLGAAPPVFSLTSLEVDAVVFPGVLDFLLPAVSSLQSLSIGVDEHREDDPLEAVTNLLSASKETLSALSLHTTPDPPCFESFTSSLSSLSALKTFEYHGTLCDCCAHLILPSLPPSTENVLFSAEPFDTVAQILRETVLAQDPATDEEGEVILPNLKAVAVPVKSKKLVGEPARERAVARGITVKGFKFISGV
ncbi:hypothetical protein JCM6882_007058 [Rhodosporidiobolus microsporus]